MSDAVNLFAPWCDPEERALRIRLHRAGDIARARASRAACRRTYAIYCDAGDLAASWVFSRASNDDLRKVLANLCRLFMIAGQIEQERARV